MAPSTSHRPRRHRSSSSYLLRPSFPTRLRIPSSLPKNFQAREVECNRQEKIIRMRLDLSSPGDTISNIALLGDLAIDPVLDALQNHPPTPGELIWCCSSPDDTKPVGTYNRCFVDPEGVVYWAIAESSADEETLFLAEECATEFERERHLQEVAESSKSDTA